jgi:hypothetical protein
MAADIVEAVYITVSVLNEKEGEVCDGKFEIVPSFCEATRMSEK